MQKKLPLLKISKKINKQTYIYKIITTDYLFSLHAHVGKKILPNEQII